MTHPAGFDFTKFVPGFDFLKNLTPGGGAAASTAAPGWVAPTLDPEELDKRIQELKTVQFWLEQNTKAVGATIQALEVQRMTLQTLKGMNMSFNDLAESLKVKAEDVQQAASKYSFESAEPAAPKAAEPSTQPAAKPKKAAKPRSKKPEAGGVDPSHWWGALTDQFQHIATHAMNDMTHRAKAHAAAAEAPSASSKTAKPKPAATQAARPAARKTTAKKTTTARKTTRTSKR